MKTGILTVVLLLCSGFFPASSASAQTDTTNADSNQAEEATENASPGSQEVEYNDENYRRFMELKDQPGQRSSLPTNTYQSGTQKLDKLPESSQKHLRNQLREIILDGAEWAPGDENKEYPYVASVAAEKDPALRQQEQEAWGELVGKYHQREAQIYARTHGKEAGGAEGGMHTATQANNAGPGRQPKGGNAEGDGSESGESGDGEEQAQAGQQNQSAHNANDGTYSPAASAAKPNNSDSVSNSGVSESALEYLLSNKLGSAESQGSPSTADTESNPEATGPPTQNISQQANPEAADPAQQQSPQQADSRQQNPAQQAAEAGQFVVISKNTLSIKDLQNARGISISVRGNSSNNTPPNNKDHDPAQRSIDDG